MKLYYYIDTGHRVGLDRLRRSAPVVKELQDRGLDAVMLTNDFRAGEYAKEEFGIKRYVSVDLVRNIANIATPADRVVLDTDDVSRSLVSDMVDYYGKIVRFSDRPGAKALDGRELLFSSISEEEGVVKCDIVAPRYFDESDHTLGNVYFWGDDDYECALASHLQAFDGLDMALLEGYYFFMQYGDELEKGFEKIYESERYDEVLKGAKRFLTSSPQSALEALAAGSKPVYIGKESTPLVLGEKLAKYGVPVLENFERETIERALHENTQYAEEVLERDRYIQVADKIADFFEALNNGNFYR